MKKTNYLFLILVALLILNTQCTTKKESTYDAVPFVKVTFLKGFINTIKPIQCGGISHNAYVFSKIDTTIQDTLTCKKILKELALLKKQEKSTEKCDVRIQCELIIPKSDTVKICIGEFNCIIKNGYLMSDNDELVYLIREYSGYYKHFSSEDLTIFRELKKRN